LFFVFISLSQAARKKMTKEEREQIRAEEAERKRQEEEEQRWDRITAIFDYFKKFLQEKYAPGEIVHDNITCDSI
jgi:hypothetical protein